MNSSSGVAPVQSAWIVLVDREQAEGAEEEADREADDQHLQRLADQHHQSDVDQLPPLQRRAAPADVRLQPPRLARNARDQEAGAEEREQPDDHPVDLGS